MLVNLKFARFVNCRDALTASNTKFSFERVEWLEETSRYSKKFEDWVICNQASKSYDMRKVQRLDTNRCPIGCLRYSLNIMKT